VIVGRFLLNRENRSSLHRFPAQNENDLGILGKKRYSIKEKRLK
jgi:hypothetical protein